MYSEAIPTLTLRMVLSEAHATNGCVSWSADLQMPSSRSAAALGPPPAKDIVSIGKLPEKRTLSTIHYAERTTDLRATPQPLLAVIRTKCLARHEPCG
jgi:hypothetical protein